MNAIVLAPEIVLLIVSARHRCPIWRCERAHRHFSLPSIRLPSTAGRVCVYSKTPLLYSRLHISAAELIQNCQFVRSSANRFDNSPRRSLTDKKKLQAPNGATLAAIVSVRCFTRGQKDAARLLQMLISFARSRAEQRSAQWALEMSSRSLTVSANWPCPLV